MSLPTLVIAWVLLIDSVPTTAPPQVDPAWDMLCNGVVQPVSKKLKPRRGGNPTRIKDSIKLCTKHVYEFSGKAEQRMAFQLRGSSHDWMILSELKGERVFRQEHVDRVFGETRGWNGILPADGKYLLTIVTAEKNPHAYTLELKSN